MSNIDGMRSSSYFLLLVLCQCATKHQTVLFEPYFRPTLEKMGDVKVFIKRLETQPVQSVYEKQRLFDLYQKELVTFSAGHPRYLELRAKLESLWPAIEEFNREVSDIEGALREKSERREESVKNPQYRRAYSDVQKLWNADLNEQALEKLRWLEEQRDLIAELEKPDRLKLVNLRFRILLDLRLYDEALVAYHQLKTEGDCEEETSQAGLWMSLLTLVGGDPRKAENILSSQCEKDNSGLAVARRNYWLARFQEAASLDAQVLYGKASQSAFPGYYQFLAQARMGDLIRINFGRANGSYRFPEFLSVSRRVHKLLERAEACLGLDLRREAAAFGLATVNELKKASDNVDTLLYVSRILSASGLHLESMKVYTMIANWVELGEIVFSGDAFIPQIFPRPFSPVVDWHARLWDIDPDFVYSIMRQESAFNPDAVSFANARGLMQLMPFLGRALSEQWNYSDHLRDGDLNKASENLKLAIFHLQQLRREFGHPVLVAAAYNAGLDRVSRWWKRSEGMPLDVFVELIPISETRGYVKMVLRNQVYYKALQNHGEIAKSFFVWDLPAYSEPSLIKNLEINRALSGR